MCVFCDKIKNNEVIKLTDEWMCIEDAYPVSPGHMLIIPKKHVASIDSISLTEWQSLYQSIKQCKAIINEKYNPDGFNIGINQGEAAGQTINHLHVHIIPRYKGDMGNPRGGVRGVIPDKQKY